MTERDEAVKHVFAYFGAAYYQADVLHRGLCNLLVWKAVTSAGAMNRYRIEEHQAAAFKMTLGQVLKEVQSCFGADDLKILEAAVEKRNFVAHHFWFERVRLMGTTDGCVAMIDELTLADDLFKKADAIVDVVAAPFLETMAGGKDAAAAIMQGLMQQALRGEPMEPLRSQRKLKKHEHVVRVYEVPGKEMGAEFLFETDDGVIWQLCDVGLGWCAADAADPSWPLSRLNEFLPATFNPRPAGAGPWRYDLGLNGATLVVRPGTVSCFCENSETQKEWITSFDVKYSSTERPRGSRNVPLVSPCEAG